MNKEIQSVEEKNQAIQADLNSNQKDLAAAKGLQAQLKNVRVLLTNHVYWSNFFNELYITTTNKVKYTSFGGSSTDNRVRVDGVSPSYTDIGKLILSLTTSQSFEEVRLVSLGPSSGSTTGYAFTLEFKAKHRVFIKE